ncbi:PEP-CTERM sorting domain-containing protein [Roseisolibacter sp. H3M3-2]|uniref:PEP-CTERM sorting domain-containing protein n=1 Tax=Roseisolibacter sp. H3M3-2 TaxID=3031323 RepID=UPI0023DBEDAA|nr:PEP-CTERM sorting domain-containing protein [Roseisolibacter sp. H3M3-2]MDF1505461.1 PEP-CTERM sorting domain-containing protein [Roseisolibacter sp. H3M3-2]
MHALLRAATVALTVAAGLAGTRPLPAQTTYFGAGARAAFAAAAATPVANDLGAAALAVPFGALGTGTVSGTGIAMINGSLFATGGGEVPAYTITFSQRLGAFGADFASLGTCCGERPFPLGEARLVFFDGASVVGTFVRDFGTGGATTFFGVAGLAGFDRVELRTNVGDEFTTDDLMVGAAAVGQAPGQVVPEPSTVALLGSGLLGLAAAARRRRATA